MTARTWLSFLLSWPAGLLVAGGAGASDHAWSRAFGGAGDQIVWRVALDGAGNVVATGSFQGTVDFGGGALTSAGDRDIFVAKFGANGNHLWSRGFGDANAQTGLGIAVDGSGNVIVTGSFNGAVNFGGLALVSAGDADIFLVKFDANGNHLWSRRFGDASTQSGASVAVDNAGNIAGTGPFRGSVDFGGVPLTSAGQEDIYLARFNANGIHLWSRRFGDAASQSGCALAAHGSGHLALTGDFQGTVDFGGGALASAGGSDVFLARFDAYGIHLWSRGFGDASPQHASGVAVDGSGSALVTGDFEGAVDFGGGPLSSLGATDIFLAKYSPVGTHLWSQAFGGSGTDRGSSMAVAGPGDIVATGRFEGTVDFGGGPLTSAGGADVFVARYGPNGQHFTSARFGDASAQYGGSVALDASRDPVAAGQFQGTVDFGGGPLSSAGGLDIFLVKFADLIFKDGFEV